MDPSNLQGQRLVPVRSSAWPADLSPERSQSTTMKVAGVG